ncbi:MAG: tRNA pseudouridine(38-40) synthase TruA [Holosporaceae bacterium]|jgi:tRNA pseudouridine38-40 synthase|nr:tRNA pseudouridine(38-40) synthase TruA [Holosporaceae bacterium]
MARYKITVEYDGSPFFGWQRQNGMDTIQQCLEEAILPLTKIPTTLYGAGRTDTGVHANGQVAHFDSARDLDCFRIQECMNAHLKDAPIAVLSVKKVSELFDARFSALERTYVYKILNRRAKACLDVLRVWNVIPYVDEEKMDAAAQYLVGKHDFSAFRAAGCQSNSPVKTLNRIFVRREGDIVKIQTSARSFLYRQVRNIVGSLVFVGCGKWSERDFQEVFHAKDRRKAAPTAPAHGLYFVNVTYPPNSMQEA